MTTIGVTTVIETSVAQETVQERQIRAFVRGANLEMIEVRGYGLTETERAEIEQDAIEIYK
ncbi:MAG: hypothetical protein M3437_01925 [Chloroflexota bacterium]|nr:hypothetical protein [Chloroflexota bacterium]